MRGFFLSLCDVARAGVNLLPPSWKEGLKKILRRDIASRSRQYREAFALRMRYLQSLPVPDTDHGPSFSFLTTVYEKTNCSLFQHLAQTVFAQTYQNYEWVILCHGHVSDTLKSELSRLGEHPVVRTYYLPNNLGITGGLRYCLDKAEKNYVIPLDADDSMESCTLAMLARSLLANNNPDLCYTNEDLLTGSIMHNPYYRPPWDPVLLQAASYVFHLTALKRDTAIALNVYTDDTVAACHDWDTMSRFHVAGKRIVHVPEILYHWRQHIDSISNAGKNRDINRLALPQVMRRFLEAKGMTESVAIEEFPIFRGITEYYYCWIAEAPFALHTIALPPGANNARRLTVFDIRPHVENAPADALVLLYDERLEFEKNSCASELYVWFSLVPQLAFFTGRVLNVKGRVEVGGLMFSWIDGRFALDAPEKSHAADAGGPYAMYLKPHCVDAVFPGFFAARREPLLQALAEIPVETAWDDVGAWLGAWAAEKGILTGWSPLFQASAPDGFLQKPYMTPEGYTAFISRHSATVRCSQWEKPMPGVG